MTSVYFTLLRLRWLSIWAISSTTIEVLGFYSDLFSIILFQSFYETAFTGFNSIATLTL